MSCLTWSWRASARLLAACGAASALACSPAAPSDSSAIPEVQSSNRPAIYEGAISPPAHDFVVYVRFVVDQGIGTCSGVLVAPNLVLTAHHCVSETLQEIDCNPGKGGDWDIPYDTSVFGIKINDHYGLYDAKVVKVLVPEESDACGRDMAALVFDRPVGDLPLAELRETPPVVGEELTAVGFGAVDNAGTLPFQRREQTGAHVLLLGPGTLGRDAGDIPVAGGNFLTSAQACGGDSGGPVLDAQGRVLGLSSRSETGTCSDGLSIYTQVAYNVSFIHGALAKAEKVLTAVPDAGVADAAPDASDDAGAATDGGAPAGSTLACAVAPAATSGARTTAPLAALAVVALAGSRRRQRKVSRRR